ncbi:hypothetical protein [Flagellimonas sp. 2504JD1-5]
MSKKNRTLCALLTLLFTGVVAQQEKNSLPYSQIYAYGMDADVGPIFSLLEEHGLNAKDQKFKSDFEARFKGEHDLGTNAPESEIETLISYFKSYWRKSLLDPTGNFERELGGNVVPFLMKNYPPVRGKKVTRDSLGYFLRDYIREKGLFTTDEVTYQGRLIDLMVWKKQTQKVYQVDLGRGETQETTVYFMQDFATLGWMEYATLGAHHPGGWTEEEGIYCVKKAYDLESENFKISYLAHEARHFADKKLWPNLKSADLEYRAKLTELSLAQNTLFHLIAFFSENANKDSENGHQIANYCVIRDLSKKLFKSEFETSKEKWKTLSKKQINKAARQLLKKNTKALKSKGSDVRSFIQS